MGIKKIKGINADTLIFASPSKEHQKDGERMYFNPTSSEFVNHVWHRDLCPGSYQTVHEIGSRGCKLLKHPGAKIPLLDHSSVKYRRDFATTSTSKNVDVKENKELAKTFKAPGMPKPPDMEIKKITRYNETHQELSVHQIRKATMPPCLPERSLVKSGRFLGQSHAQTVHADPTGIFDLPKKVVPTHNIEIQPRKLDFWVSEKQKAFRTGPKATRKSRSQRSQDLDVFFGALQEDSQNRLRQLERTESSPAMCSRLQRPFAIS